MTLNYAVIIINFAIVYATNPYASLTCDQQIIATE